TIRGKEIGPALEVALVDGVTVSAIKIGQTRAQLQWHIETGCCDHFTPTPIRLSRGRSVGEPLPRSLNHLPGEGRSAMRGCHGFRALRPFQRDVLVGRGVRKTGDQPEPRFSDP